MIVQGNITPESIVANLRYLQLLSRSFPTTAVASIEIINLEAILSLPKGTEHFLTDIHGEYEAFQRALRNASGAVKQKVNEIFGHTLREIEKKELCIFTYYPEEKLQLIGATEADIDGWYLITFNQLVKVCQNVSSRYTHSKVRKSLPAEFSYIIQELLHESIIEPNKRAYTNVITSTIISTRRTDDFIMAMCNLIQRLMVDSLHIAGDIYDRGPSAHIVVDTLRDYHNFDIQQGNHDILWMGAASGNEACVANVIRLSMRCGSLGVLEDGYGINLLPLATFTVGTYADDPCTVSAPRTDLADSVHNEKTSRLITQMYKAITIIQFKLEVGIINRRPEFNMEGHRLLEKIDFERRVFVYGGKEYSLRGTNFPTVDPVDPCRLSDEGQELIERIHYSFMDSEELKKHIRCLFTYGDMYLVCNSNLLYHTSVPLNENGGFKHMNICRKEYQGKNLPDKIDRLAHTAYFDEDDEEEKRFAMDYIWYLWCGLDTLSFDKDKMATFERYFTADRSLHKETKGCYYALRNKEEICGRILEEFGVTGQHTHITSGRVPVRTIKGRQPMKAGGKLLMIDGGFSKAYQPETGIAGYTLVYYSHGLQLVQHESFQSTQKAIEEGQDVKSTAFVIEFNSRRMMAKDTDKGKELVTQIQNLEKLLVAYRIGLIKKKVRSGSPQSPTEE